MTKLEENKYQEALDIIKDYIYDGDGVSSNAYDTLQDLVDKATPKKLIYFTEYEDRVRCPHCENILSSSHAMYYCYVCGGKFIS